MASPADPETKSCAPADAKEPLIVAAMAPLTPLPPVAGAGDLELRLLQAAGEYAAHGLVRSYQYAKHSSRALGFVASSTETVVTKAGLVALVKFVYETYLRLGHPVVRYVDDAVGRCVVGAFVRVLLAVEYQQPEGSLGMLTANGESLQLTYYERLQALLYGQVPRLQGLIMEMYACAEKARNAPPPVTFDPEDYVLKDEIARLQQATAEKMHEQEHKLAEMKEQLEAADGIRQRLENEMKSAAAAEMAERQRLLEEKELTIAALNEQILAVELAREQLTRELQTSQEGRERDSVGVEKEAQAATLQKLVAEAQLVVAEKEAQVATLQNLIAEAQLGREQLRANLREALDLKDEERLEALSAKDQEVATLKSEIEAVELARKKLEDDLKAEVEAAEGARKLIEQELKTELQAAELARAQLEKKLQDEAQAAEMARQKIEDERKSELEAEQLAREKAEEQLKREVEAAEAARKAMEQELERKVEAAELARKQAEQELEATRTRMESEHTKRLKELEEELARAKLAASEKADSLRQQRTSFNANLVKDYVQHAKGDEPRKPRAASVSDNQREDEELTMSARSSSTSSAASPRSEELKKAKAEKEKLNARMRRVLGSRF